MWVCLRLSFSSRSFCLSSLLPPSCICFLSAPIADWRMGRAAWSSMSAYTQGSKGFSAIVAWGHLIRGRLNSDFFSVEVTCKGTCAPWRPRRPPPPQSASRRRSRSGTAGTAAPPAPPPTAAPRSRRRGRCGQGRCQLSIRGSAANHAELLYL